MKININWWAIGALAVAIFGIILSFILGFPFNFIIGPIAGMVVSVIAIVLSIFGVRYDSRNEPKIRPLAWTALAVSVGIFVICLARQVSLTACIGNTTQLITTLITR